MLSARRTARALCAGMEGTFNLQRELACGYAHTCNARCVCAYIAAAAISRPKIFVIAHSDVAQTVYKWKYVINGRILCEENVFGRIWT